MWNFSRVRMKFVKRVILSFTYVRCKRLTMIFICILIISLSIFCNKVIKKRIRTRSIIWSIGQCNDVLIRCIWKAFNIPDLIYILFCQFSRFHLLIPHFPSALQRYATGWYPCLWYRSSRYP